MTGPAQLPHLLNILRESRTAGHCCFTAGDFCYRWATETSHHAAPVLRLWRDDGGRDAGFSWLSGDHLHIITTAETFELRDKILTWGEQQLRETQHGPTLRIPINDRVSAWKQLLAQRGYRAGEPELVLRSRPVESVVASQATAEGYRIDHIQHPSQVEGWAAAYRAAFAPEEMTVELRLAVSRSPLYRPDLDLIACNSSGDVVAFALAWFDPETASGAFEPVGCDPVHQRRGLTRTLMLEGLRRLSRIGAQRAYVTTTRRRLPANRLYESLGFREEAASQTWNRLV